MARRTSYALVHQRSDGDRAVGMAVEVELLADEAGMHPELVRRLERLGLLDPVRRNGLEPLYPRDAAARLARAVRLRRDLGLNYAGAVLACELLARIDELEARLRRYERIEPTDDADQRR
jgi:DNA-binding transcriptional MerR regulator